MIVGIVSILLGSFLTSIPSAVCVALIVLGSLSIVWAIMTMVSMFVLMVGFIHGYIDVQPLDISEIEKDDKDIFEV